MIAAEAPRPRDPALPSPRQAWFSLIALTVVVMFTVLDRQVLALLIEPIKADYKISDTQAAILLGAAFSLTYALAGLPIARLADRMNRRNLVAACLAFWSASTIACGMAPGYGALLLARMGVGVGESGYGPAAWSIVTDSFPRERVAFATGILGIGAMVGTGLAMFLGGVVLGVAQGFGAVALPLVGVLRPWQWAFVIVGAPGLVWTLVLLATREPARRGMAGAPLEAVPVRAVAAFVLARWRSYLATIGGTCLKSLLSLAPSLWLPSLFVREFGWNIASAGIALGVVTIVFSPLSMVAGGRIAEAWARRGIEDANMRIVLHALWVAVPLGIVLPLLPGPWWVLAAYAVQTIATGLGFGPGIASFQLITPNAMRAQIGSLTQFGSNVLAFALSPLIVALMTDYLFRDPAYLKYSIALCGLIFGPVALWAVAQGMGAYRRDYAAAVRAGY